MGEYVASTKQYQYQQMYKIHKSKSTQSKYSTLTPSSKSSRQALQSSRQILHRSASGNKKIGCRPIPMSPLCRQRTPPQLKDFSKVKQKELLLQSQKKKDIEKQAQRYKLYNSQNSKDKDKELQKQKSKSKIHINSLNFNLIICNKEPSLCSPFNQIQSVYSNRNKIPPNLIGGPTRNNFFKANQKINTNNSNNNANQNNSYKTISRINQVFQKKRRQQKQKDFTSRFEFNPIKVLAKGQYGNIYLAYSKQTNYMVVLKTFIKQKVTLDFMIDQFKIQLYCRHPNILPAYGFFFGKTEVYLIMEAGMYNLYHQIKVSGYLSQKKTATYIHQILKGLSYLHLNGIIHRDIKPQNIIVCGNVVKITDFGWSIITKNQRVTYCGTLDYVSPEVCYGVPYDNKIDCWSVGVLAYQMLTGFPPFQTIATTNQTQQNVANMRIKKQRPVLNYKQKLKFPSTVSKLCKQFILKMLALDPKDRPSIVEALRDDWISNYSDEFKKKQNNLVFDTVQ